MEYTNSYDHIISRFEDIVQHNSDSISLDFNGEIITYAELDEKSDNLASFLKDYYEASYGEPIVSGKIIGLYQTRGIDLIISMFAVLKLDAVFMPIGLDYPESRVAFLLESTETNLVLTLSGLQPKINRVVRKFDDEVLLIDVDDELLYTSNVSSTLSDVNRITGNIPAYLLHTSGSTGKPKGVMVGHAGVVNLANYHKDVFRITTNSRTLGFADYCFDASIWEIFGTLLNGGCYVILNDDVTKSLDRLAEGIAQTEITHATLPPSILSQLDKKIFTSLKVLTSAGEPLSMSQMQTWSNETWMFFNAYGPTETTVCALMHNCEPTDKEVYLGVTVPNTAVKIVDEYLSDVDVGEQGELLISGIGLALSYYNNKKMTEENFIEIESVRWYRSGDIVKRSNNGGLIYVGRLDDQIKFRGYRIELGEIESILNSLTEIVQCAVILDSAETHGKIIAFFKPEHGADKDSVIEIMRSAIRDNLPHYMMPQAFYAIEEFKLTRNKKIDKNALTGIKLNSFNEIYPENSVASKITKIWNTVLGSECHVQPSDDFFDIGGHSLLVTQVIVMIKKEIGVSITMQEFMSNSILSELDTFISNRIDSSNVVEDTTEDSLNNIVPDHSSINEPFPLTDIQQAYYLGRKPEFELGGVATNIYREFIYKDEKFDVNKLEVAVNKLIDRHEMLRCKFLGANKQIITIKSISYKIKCFNFSSKDDSFNNHIKSIREDMTTKLLTVDKPPMFEIMATILPDQTILHFLIDALVIDGWSYYIFFDELSLLYQGVELDSKTDLTFRDYVLAESKQKKSKEYLEDKEYWLERLENFPLGPDLPLSTTPNRVTTPKTATKRTIIPDHVWHKISNIGKKFSLSKTSILLGLFAEVLYRWSNSERFIINLTLFNRLPLHKDVNKIIGDFSSLELLEVNYNNRIKQSFVEFSTMLQKQLYSDLDHRSFSGVEIQRKLTELLGNDITGSRMPIVFTCFLENDNQDNKERPSTKYFGFKNLQYGSTNSSQVWLDFKSYEERNQLVIEWDYVSDLFEQSTIDQMHDEYISLVERLVDSKHWLDQGMPPSNNSNQIRGFSDVKIDATLISEMVNAFSRFKDNVALESTTEKYTYNEINKFIQSFARLLLDKQGCLLKKGSIVAICMKKSCQQILATLTTVYSGHVFMPIDPEAPSDRINLLLTQAKVKCIITDESMYASISNLKYILDSANCGIAVMNKKQLLSNPVMKPAQVSSVDLAYIIYTSGSTGLPKGVMIEHASVVNTVHDITDRFNVTEQDNLIMLSNLTFDLSIYDIFGAIFNGATLVVPDDSKRKDPSHWLELITSKHISIWNSAPMFMQMLLEYVGYMKIDVSFNFLRLVLLSGDWIPIEMPRKIMSLCKSDSALKVVSLGGATECSIWSILYEIDSIKSHWNSIPYGMAMRNQGVYVLNSMLCTCPSNVTGDIYITGVGLARGYLNDDKKTSEQFITHPTLNLRLYKTGDKGRYYEDGNIEFLGRIDNQVKLSGFRIELGEIEHHLRDIDGVTSAVVKVLPCINDRKRIVAFVKQQKTGSVSNKASISDVDLNELNAAAFPYDNKINAINLIDKTSYKKFMLNHDSSLKTYRDFIKTDFNYRLICEELIKNYFSEITLYKSNVDEGLLSILSILAGFKLKERAVAARRYPSSSSIYAVHTYISIFSDNNDFPRGIYLYHPLTQQIELVSEIASPVKDAAIKITFSADMKRAIDKYGEELARELVDLEMGYLIGSIKNFIRNISVESSIDEQLLVVMKERKQIPLLELLYDQDIPFNYSNFLQKIRPIVYIKSKIFSGLLAWDQSKEVLEVIDDTFVLSENDFVGENALVFKTCSIVLFFNATDNSTLSYYSAGAISQYFREKTKESRIGVCPQGEISLSLKRKLANYGYDNIIHTLIAGSVTNENMSAVNSFIVNDHTVSEMSIERKLKNKLPSHMLPDQYVIIEEFPVTSNGKVDFNKLFDIAQDTFSVSQDFIVRPEGEIENLIYKIWAVILDINNFSCEDHFVRLGGNSLLYIQLLNKLETTFSIDIPLGELMHQSTVRHQANYIEKLLGENKILHVSEYHEVEL